MSARLVVTLPPRVDALAFARDAERRGADLLELRNDLHADAAMDVVALASVIPVLVAARGRPLAPAWRAVATLVDTDRHSSASRAASARAGDQPPHHGIRGDSASARAGDEPPHQGIRLELASHHAEHPLSPDEAVALWEHAAVTEVKHVEPLGEPSTFPRLLETRTRLARMFARVTVLATGPLALPFRCVLAEDNALDYVALDASFLAAPGQRLLDDAVRGGRARGLDGSLASTSDHGSRGRLGILGSAIAGSRSPRIHRQPFDRIELPEDAPVDDVVSALVPHYAGFAVTSPFKRAAARLAGSELDAVNTLVRRGDRYEGANTDVDGARAVLEALAQPRVTILGDGGATDALRLAARELHIELAVVRARDVDVSPPIRGAAIWTWPARVAPPASLAFAERAPVAVIAYGDPARSIAARIVAAGGVPRMLGPRWLIAQARRQRALWQDAS